MSPSIAITLSPEARQIAASLTDMRGALRAVAAEIATQDQLTIAHISEARMRGNNGQPFPVAEHKLGVISGHLRRSLRAIRPRIEGDRVISGIGTNVNYAAVHEFGAVIKRVLLAGSVRLATDRKGNLLRGGRNGKLAVFARRSRKSVLNVPFAGGKRYEVRIPARAPIQHGIADRIPALGAAVSNALIAHHRGATGGNV